MPNIVPRLDENRSYIYCAQCESQFKQKIEMRRDGHLVKCPLGHTMEHTHLAGVPDMVPLRVTEMPSERAVKKEFWIIPEVYDHLQQKYAGRFLVTMGTFFDHLANDSVLFIAGEDAKKLRELGFKNGTEMAALAVKMKEQDELIEQMQKAISVIKPILQAANIDVAGLGI